MTQAQNTPLSPEELFAEVNTRRLAEVSRRRVKMSGKDGKSISKTYSSESVVGTEMRRLLRNALRRTGSARQTSLLITSSMIGEGKSTISACMAMAAAIDENKRTLLVDFDLRRPTIHKLFALPIEHGIADLLRQDTKLEKTVHSTDVPNLKVVTAGALVPNPTTLLSDSLLKPFFDYVKFSCDLLIVDCAPIIPVSDPVVLSSYVDGVVMVIRAGVTRREIVRRAHSIMDEAGANIIGVALNNVGGVLPYHYNYKYYQYNHGSKKEK